VGRMVLNRNVDNFFAETEQVAFLPSNVVPGIDFSNDPLLQGRLFSYQDTQLSRLGGPNFHQIPVNAPRCPMHNFQRDGLRQMEVPKGRVNYEPNSFDTGGPRENPTRGFVSHPEPFDATKERKRSETFADHYSQARLFYRSMTEPEKRHMAGAFAFELAHVETLEIRLRMLGHLAIIDGELHRQVADALGMDEKAKTIQAAVAPRDLPLSPSLSLIEKMPTTLAGRKIGVLLTDGFDAVLLEAIQTSAKREKASVALIAPKVGGVKNDGEKRVAVDFSLSSAPSVFFDTLVILASKEGAAALSTESAAIQWLGDGFAHLKVIGHSEEAGPLLELAGVAGDEGIIRLGTPKAVGQYMSRAKKGRIWDREPKLRSVG